MFFSCLHVKLMHFRLCRFTAYTNFIRIETNPDKGVFQYDVKFNPSLDSKALRYVLMRQIAPLIGDTKSFDGAILYLPVLLDEKVSNEYVHHYFRLSNVFLC